MIKFNFLTGLMYYLYKGGTFDKEIKDSKGCTLAHWSAFMDRRLFLTICWRAGVDMHGEDESRMTPFDRALDNWSIHTLN